MKNGSKFEKLCFDRGLKIEDVKRDTGISPPTLSNFNKGRIKKYHNATIKVLCEYFSTAEKQITEEDLIGFTEEHLQRQEQKKLQDSNQINP